MPERLKVMKQMVFPLRPYHLLDIDRLRTIFESLDKKKIIKDYHSKIVNPKVCPVSLLSDMDLNRTKFMKGTII